MISVYYTGNAATRLPDRQWEALFHTLPFPLAERILRLKRWQDRQAALMGKLLLKTALFKYGYSMDYLAKLQYNKYGRPYLPLPVDFNISHSGNYVICAITKSGKVGIDIEKIQPIDFSNFTKVMTTEEWLEIKKAEDSLKCFYRYWALKESIIKGEGKGLSIPLQDIKIRNKKAVLYGKTWYLRELKIDNGHCSFLAHDVKGKAEIEEIINLIEK